MAGIDEVHLEARELQNACRIKRMSGDGLKV